MVMTADHVRPTTGAIHSAERKVASIDLRMVRMKLADPEEGKGWERATLDLVERDYRRFLILNILFPEHAIVPNQPVDTMWHAHILDTRAYAQDCKRVFGEYLHHFPYFGMRGPRDAEDLCRAADATANLYEAVFGDRALEAGAASCKRTSCKPQKCK